MDEVESFWGPSKYFTSPAPITDDDVVRAERLLGYHLPAAYVALLRIQNGGAPRRTAFPTAAPTSWADDHVAIDGIAGIGGQWGIDSESLGSRFMIDEWGYPPIGIVFGQCPSAGHDAIMLDYRACGPDGEPAVVHVDVESARGPRITPLASDFRSFVEGLVDADTFDDREAELASDTLRVQRGSLSPLLAELCAAAPTTFPIETALRALAAEIVAEKGVFALHSDARSHLLYDAQLWLYAARYPTRSVEEYLAVYPKMLVFEGGFSTGGYAPAFVSSWMEQGLASGRIEPREGRLCLSPGAERELLATLGRVVADP